MMMTARSWGAAWMLFAMVACARESNPPPQKDSGKAAAAKAEAKPAAPAPSAEPAAAAEPATPAPTKQLSAESASAPAAPVDPADPLGRRFADPAWFRRDMLEGAKAMDVSRSERTPAGLFSSQILLELPAGTTAEQCAEQLEKKVGSEVTNLVRTPDEKAPGRIKISGETSRYRVTLMCGEAKGVMRAYVSFEWLS
jgi:hypothetical protein